MILGIDYGLRNIGLAISEGEIAEPWGAVGSLEGIKGVISGLGVTLIVVGVSEGRSREKAMEFGRELSDVLRLPVEFVDETLSTHEANKRTRGTKGEHARAAAIILQRFLDERRSNV